jgi:hypothetical protein
MTASLPPARRLATLAALAVTAGVFVTYSVHALLLIRYPWDWSPDEGLALDYARRLLQDPRSLYPFQQVVPFPAAYTPALAALLAPFTVGSAHPLLAARVIAYLWTAACAAAVYVLARRRAPLPLAALAAAAVLAPLGLSYWHMLVRVDGPMLACWLWAAVPLLPAELRRGADRLSWGRLAGGAALLLLAVLCKPTAVVHGAPLVLGWLLVDLGSALRLGAVMAAAGGALYALLQILTGGGFAWVMGLWGQHPYGDWVLFYACFYRFAAASWPVLLWVLAALLLGRGARAREASWLMVIGGLLITPALAKYGAWWNYLLPFQCALVVLAARAWGEARWLAGAAGGALAAAVALLVQPFPLPDRGDEATGRAFYAFVQQRGAPLLATRPDLAYYLVGQKVETEAASFPWLVALGTPGIDTILERVQSRHYNTVVIMALFWARDPRYRQALNTNYALVGSCALGRFYGPDEYLIFAPLDRIGAPLVPPPGTRCVSGASLAQAAREAPASR